jgi:hypothetical protein
LLDSNNNIYDPALNPYIGFDVCISDLDSGQSSRQRQVWSNVGLNGEDWITMEYAGLIRLGYFEDDYTNDPCLPVAVIPSMQYLITPTLATTFINVPPEITNLDFIDILGRKAVIMNNNTGMVDISSLTYGIYNVRLFRNKEYLGCQRIIKY